MARWLFLGPVLGLLVVGGCGVDGGDDEVAPTVSQGSEVTVADPDGLRCDAVGAIPPSIRHAVGAPVTLLVRSGFVTSSCRCQSTTTADWGCNGKKHCTSEYDNGGPNPVVCGRVSSSPTAAEGTTATVDRAGCTVAVAVDPRDANLADLTVRCASEGDVSVRVVSYTAGAQNTVTLRFTDGGTCPVEADAGDADDGGDGGAGDPDGGADANDSGEGDGGDAG